MKMTYIRLITWFSLVLLAVSGSAPVMAFDAELLKGRLMPRPADAARNGLTVADGPAWQSDEERLAERRSKAMRLSQSTLVDNLQGWARNTPFESVEKLRRTDIKLGSDTPTRMFGKNIDFSVRVSEQLRLLVAAADFHRNILYDPLDERMWVDLWRLHLPESRTGLKLTNVYRLDNASTNLLLKIDHQLQ